MLVAKKISKTFNRFKALENIDIEITAGTITALIGPSGAGKSTLIRALSLIDPPSNGEITIDGIPYFPLRNDRDFMSPWPDVTVVFQQLFLWPHLTLRENIELPASRSNSHENMQRANELIKLFNLEDIINKLPFQASIGQRQRAAIVRAMALKPKYLMLDEITSALDVEQISKLADSLDMLRAEGCAIIIVTHLLGFARTIADDYLFLDKGHCLEKNKIDKLYCPANSRVKKFVALSGTAPKS